MNYKVYLSTCAETRCNPLYLVTITILHSTLKKQKPLEHVLKCKNDESICRIQFHKTIPLTAKLLLLKQIHKCKVEND